MNSSPHSSPVKADLYPLDFKVKVEDEDPPHSFNLSEKGDHTSLCTSPRLGSPLLAALSPRTRSAVLILVWVSLSAIVIVFNKFVLTDLAFPYPIFLTTFHLLFASLGTRVLAHSTHLLDGLNNVEMTYDRWLKSIVPIGVLFSASLIFGNVAYLTLSVSFIQMLKSITAVTVLLMSIAAGLETPNARKLVIVLAISIGVALASYGELKFVMSGFLFQALAIVCESLRLIAIQKLLHGLKMDPLVSLYHFAPVCAFMNLCILPFTEGFAPFVHLVPRLGMSTLFINASCAFLLNVSSVSLIGAASGLVLTLSGVLKAVALVIGSVLFFDTPVSALQIIGYSIALVGLVIFQTPKDVVDGWVETARKLVQA